ncbi:Fic family protein [Paenibacillus jiagnxiensis]|uniref:Fic family protein n=1 Tax=Paenibacillus jiagnxiensis TaxID=3228926 RepID=UPI003493F43C
MFAPKYSITDRTACKLMDIERASAIVDLILLPSSILDLLKKESMEKTVILSTKIEGNTLDEATKRKVLYHNSSDNEEQEVYNLMKALEYLDEADRRQLPVTEEFIKKLHAIIKISHGRRPRISEYREEQNQVGSRNASGFYLPPEWNDVPVLMEDLVAWINAPTKIEPELIRKLDPQQRMVFAQLTFKQDSMTTSEMRELLRLSDRSIREKVSLWREARFIEPRDHDVKRVRSIKLTEAYEQLAQEIRSSPEKFPHFLK